MEERISRKGYKQLCHKYEELEQKISNIQKAMQDSVRRDNDLSENHELVELRIQAMYTLPKEKETLLKRIHNCEIIEDTDLFKKFDGTTIIPGVTVSCQIDDELELFTILGDKESDMDEQIVSCIAPIAKAILGRHINDRIDFNGMTITIKSIERY